MKKLISQIILILICLPQSTIAADFNKVDIHGFISQGYAQTNKNNFIFHNSKDGTFEFNELAINFSTMITDNLHLGIQFFARDLGNIGNDKIVLDWAFADYHWRDWAGLRIGKLKVPFGFYNETREMDMLRDNILLPASVYLENWRDVLIGIKGGCIYGSLLSNILGSFDYEFLFGVLDIDTDSGVTILIENNQKADSIEVVRVDGYEIDDYFVSNVQWQPPLEGLKFSFSYVMTEMAVNSYLNPVLGPGLQQYIPETIAYAVDPAAPFNADHVYKGALSIYAGEPLDFEINNAVAYVISGGYTLMEFVLTTEYMHFTYDLDMQIKGLPETKTKIKDYIEGYYLGVSYRFLDWLVLGISYSELFDDAKDKHGDRFKERDLPRHFAWLKDWAVSSRFDFNDSWILKLEGHTFDGSSFAMSRYNPNNKRVRYWNMGLVKLSYSF